MQTGWLNIGDVSFETASSSGSETLRIKSVNFRRWNCVASHRIRTALPAEGQVCFSGPVRQTKHFTVHFSAATGLISA